LFKYKIFYNININNTILFK